MWCSALRTLTLVNQATDKCRGWCRPYACHYALLSGQVCDARRNAISKEGHTGRVIERYGCFLLHSILKLKAQALSAVEVMSGMSITAVDWPKLFAPHEYFTQHNHYIQIVAGAAEHELGNSWQVSIPRVSQRIDPDLPLFQGGSGPSVHPWIRLKARKTQTRGSRPTLHKGLF